MIVAIATPSKEKTATHWFSNVMVLSSNRLDKGQLVAAAEYFGHCNAFIAVSFLAARYP